MQAMESTEGAKVQEVPSVQTCTLDDLSKIRQSAEALNPGVSQRVSAADYESIVVATLQRFTISSVKRASFTPAPSVATEMSATIRDLSTAVAQLSPAKSFSRVVSRPGPSAGQKLSSGETSKAKKSSSKRKPQPKGSGKSPGTAGQKAEGGGTPKAVGTGLASRPPPSPKRSAKERLLRQCLRALDSKAWAPLTAVRGLTKEKVRDAVEALKEEDVAVMDSGVPRLIRSGVLSYSDTEQSLWADEVENLDFLRNIEMARAIFEKSKLTRTDPSVLSGAKRDWGLYVPEQPAPAAAFVFPDWQETSVSHDQSRKRQIPAIFCHLLNDTALASLSKDLKSDPETVTNALRITFKKVTGPHGHKNVVKCVASMPSLQSKHRNFCVQIGVSEDKRRFCSLAFFEKTSALPAGQRISVANEDMLVSDESIIDQLLGGPETSPTTKEAPMVPPKRSEVPSVPKGDTAKRGKSQGSEGSQGKPRKSRKTSSERKGFSGKNRGNRRGSHH